MKVLGIIPARFASTRFPGKPLTDIHGKPMIQRVYEQASKAKKLSKVYVATDDLRIADAIKRVGGESLLTKDSHRSGTDRCKEALEKAELETGLHFDAVVNIQGDEPYIHPEQIDELVSLLELENVHIATLAKKVDDLELVQSPNTIKVVLNHHQFALYFSRSILPYFRENVEIPSFLKHIGIYGYQSEILKKITELPASYLEIAENLEQLRWLENGYSIKVGITNFESQSVDVPEDILKLKFQK